MKKLSFTKLNENKDSEFILKNCNFTHSKTSVFDPIKEGLFCAAHRWGGAKRSRDDETWHSYTLPKEDPRNM